MINKKALNEIIIVLVVLNQMYEFNMQNDQSNIEN